MKQKFETHLLGLAFGKLTVVGPTFRLPCGTAGKARKHVVALCECGTYSVFWENNLLSGRSKSCGCWQRALLKAAAQTHGLSSAPEYSCWLSMIRRCYDEHHGEFKNYGGRGLVVHGEWLKSVEAFISDVRRDIGKRPSRFYSIDRIDTNGHYEPGNIRWSTQSVQNRNRRNNRSVTIDGVTKLAVEWIEEYSLNPNTFRARLRRGVSGAQLLSHDKLPRAAQVLKETS